MYPVAGSSGRHSTKPVLAIPGYQDRGFAPSNANVATLNSLIGHAPRRYEDFVRETAAEWSE